MNTISREEACCIFYCKQSSEENIKICTERVAKIEEAQICYKSNPNEPEIVSEARLFGAPKLYHLYISKNEIKKKLEETKNNKNEKEDVLFCNDAQIVDFINYVYRPEIESSPDSEYKLYYVYDKEILGIVWSFTNRFDNSTPLAFTQWLNKQKVDFLTDKPERKVVQEDAESKKLRRRHLNVLDAGHYVDLAKNIIDVLPRHHAYIDQLKNDGYHIVGYCRKSKTPTNNRAVLLQRMVNILRQRSLVDKVFVSSYSNVKQSFCKRDLNDEEAVLSDLDDVNGNTQDFLAFVQNNDKVCVVALDYAGFTTNMSDLSDYPKMQKITIDLYFYENKFQVFDRNQLLDNVEDLKLFNCRPNYKQ